MSKVLAYTKDMPQDEWHKWRMKGIGGSDAPTVCGFNPYKSIMELWLEKTGQAVPTEAGEAAYRGKVMEPIIIQEFQNRTGIQVGEELTVMQHEKYPFMIANIDGIAIHPQTKEPCLFEAKTASSYRSHLWDDDIPEEYMIQVQHYLEVTGLRMCYIAVLIGGNRFKYELIERDDELINYIISLEKIFWGHVISGEPPTYDGSKASSEMLNKMYPKAKPKSVIILPEQVQELLNQYEEAEVAEKDAGFRKDEAVNQLKELLKNNDTGIIGDRVVTWKNVESERFDSAKFKKEEPSTYAKYTKKTSYRRFMVK
jgi:putative phage-type endonuclease